MLTTRRALFALAAGSSLLSSVSLSSCIKAVGPFPPPGPISPVQVVQYLAVAEKAGEAILAAIGPAAGMSAEQVVEVSRLMAAIGNAVGVAGDELASSDNVIVQLANIETAFRLAIIDSAVLDRLPPNVKGVVTAALAAADAAIAAIRSFYSQPAVSLTARRVQTSFSAGDQAKLRALAVRGRKLAGGR